MANQDERKQERISIERCRELLAQGSNALTDEQVIELRDAMCVMAQIICSHFMRGNEKKKKKKRKSSMGTKPASQKYFRKKDAAEYLGVSERVIGDLMKRRVIPYHKPSHRICLLRKEDLDAAMARYRVNAVGETYKP